MRGHKKAGLVPPGCGGHKQTSYFAPPPHTHFFDGGSYVAPAATLRKAAEDDVVGAVGPVELDLKMIRGQIRVVVGV